MPSGLVFVAIVVIWAVILAPRIVRVYERGTSQRTTQRFRSAMSVLGRSQQDPVRVVHTSKREVPPGSATLVTHNRSTAAARRRRTLMVLCSLPVITVLATVVGAVPAALTLVSILPAVAFVAACARVPLRSTAPVRVATDAQVATDAELTSSSAQVVPPTRRFIPAVGVVGPKLVGLSDRDLFAFRSRSSAASSRRRGAWSQAQELSTRQAQEQQDALAATFSSVEEQLGLEQYVASPSGVDGLPYKRAANE